MTIGGRAFACLLLVSMPLIQAGCSERSVVLATQETGSVPIRASTAAVSDTMLPTGASKVGEMELDLDGDARVERVLVWQAAGQIGVAIAATGDAEEIWSESLPEGLTFAGLSSEDLNGDGLPEVLLRTDGPEAYVYELRIINWVAGEGRFLTPKGGPLEGYSCYRSQWYLPLLDDLDMNGAKEIVVTQDTGDPHFLTAVVYEWDRTSFANSVLYLMPPRVIPTPAIVEDGG